MISNEKRAHDLAVAITYSLLNNALSDGNEIEISCDDDPGDSFNAYRVYKGTYYALLNCFRDDFQQ